ncbi:MAG TPA: NAD(P)-dependent oxidoreductase [Dongiaceae bacterium]|nr:NAD(P)-dependent oxidoreductase [Dongiaceae bacterium]
MAERKRVGFIGVGLMGHGIAKNIVEKGYALTVLGHRNRQPVEDLLRRGAKEAKSPAELARAADLIFICVTGSPQVEDIIFRKDGLLEGLEAGSIVVDCSTAEPDSTARVAAAVVERGGRFLDLPLVRTPKEAEEGRLVVIAGAEPATLDEVRPVLATFAENVVYAGGVGAGHKLKLIHNYLALAVAAVVAEGVTTAIKTGVDLKALSDICMSGGADSVMFRRFSKYFLEGDDSLAKFAIVNAAKDVRYYTHLTETASTASFIAVAVHQVYQLAAIQGHGDKYLPRMVDVLADLNHARK